MIKGPAYIFKQCLQNLSFLSLKICRKRTPLFSILHTYSYCVHLGVTIYTASLIFAKKNNCVNIVKPYYDPKGRIMFQVNIGCLSQYGPAKDLPTKSDHDWSLIHDSALRSIDNLDNKYLIWFFFQVLKVHISKLIPEWKKIPRRNEVMQPISAYKSGNWKGRRRNQNA